MTDAVTYASVPAAPAEDAGVEAQGMAAVQRSYTQINRMTRCSPINIEFEDLTYSIRQGGLKAEFRQLLKSVNGVFRAGELTGIMGPSGAGKSTLLNILAGYVSAGVKGSITINGRPRDLKVFNKLSSYIMQEDLVQPRLSVRESMMIAANLKLSSHIDQEEKVAIVNEVMTLLGLVKCADTKSEYLSGGQRKRLVVALELVNNPPVIFLDEPTTGLDNFAIKQCMELLHKISRQGRTVVCTIHQPPSSLFQLFDQVYIVANGYCVYNGNPSQLVPYLSMNQMVCPPTYTPADFIIEVIAANPGVISTLSSSVQNGKVNYVDTHDKSSVFELEEVHDTRQASDIHFVTSFWTQFIILISRMLKQLSRNSTVLYIQFFHHSISGVLIGGLFWGSGNNAQQTIAIFKYCVATNVFFMYTHVMCPILLFPLEVKLLKREYFNRWYSLKAYYSALTIATLPMLVFNGCMFITIIYFMTDQPLEFDRFMRFLLINMAVAICSQGLGYAIGSVCSILKGSIVGPAILAPMMALSVYGMGYRDTIESYMKFFMKLDYMRYGIVGATNAIFNNRYHLDCKEEEVYCHFTNPNSFLKELDMVDTSYSVQMTGVMVSFILFRVIGYMALKLTLNKDFSTRIAFYASKIVKMPRKL